MFVRSLRPFILAASSLALAGCADHYGSYGYGHSRVSVGVGVGSGWGYHNPWGPGWYSHPYYGWYDGFYYPGTGFWVFDRWGTRHRWSPHHRSFWESRRQFVRDPRHWQHRPPNWSGWRGPPPRSWQPPRRGWDGRQPSRRDWQPQWPPRRD